MITRYLIWSNQHHAWWRADKRGYTDIIEEAGRYDLGSAVRIVSDATLGGTLTYTMSDPVTGRVYEMLDEYVVPAPEIIADAAEAEAES